MKRVVQLFLWCRQPSPSDRLSPRYGRSADGRAIVRVHLHSPAALLLPFERFPPNFSSDRSPLPFLNLNQTLVDYLFACLAEIGDESVLLQIVLPPIPEREANSWPTATDLRVAIQQYFAYLEGVRRQALQQLVRDSIFLGCLGITALATSLPLDSRNPALQGSIALPLLGQGVTVFGWLTFWEASANALWNWRPLYQQMRLCQRLQQARIELETDEAELDGVARSGGMNTKVNPG